MKTDSKPLRFLVFALCSLLGSCRQSPSNPEGFSKEGNYYFKLLEIGDSEKGTDTTLEIKLDVVCRTLHDSVFWDTKHKWNGSFLISYQSFSFSPRIFKYAKGDSLLFLLPPKIFFREFFKCPTPYFIKNDSSVKFSIRILGVQNRYANSSAPSLVTQDSLLKSEKNGIVRFAQQKLPGSHPLSSGIYIEIKSSISGDSVRTNSKVSIAYKGYFLDGQLMDQSPGDAPLEISMGQEKQVLDGLRIVLLHLKNGDKAKIILPSRLAYGSSGSSNGSIPPFTPLFYELKVINVK